MLVFLDAHCEPSRDWLRPLLQRIKQDRHAVLTPLIYGISQKHFGISGGLYYFQVTSLEFWVSLVVSGCYVNDPLLETPSAGVRIFNHAKVDGIDTVVTSGANIVQT